MRNYFSFIVLAFILLAVVYLTGCSTPQTTITELDKDGNITKITKTGERDAIDKLTDSTKNKSVIAWTDGWIAYISVSTATTEDPTPTGKISAGKVAKGYISLLPNQQNLEHIAEIIRATKTNLSVTTSGIDSSSSTKTKVSDSSATETTKEAAAAAEVKD